QAGTLREFWQNLKAGRDCVTEIPRERWDADLYYDADKTRPGKTYSKWGGFIEGVDQFDPFFFHISPREAEIMDPQERLILQYAYAALEDAGYTRGMRTREQGQSIGMSVGVYIGAMYEEYQLYGAQEQVQGRSVALSGSLSAIANRVSYFCNFSGPSMAVDTMCSSSLTALHLACGALSRGECEYALVGGINISVHPNKYLNLGQGKFASSKGRCESFGEGGDGYVPGEGVGVVLLKPLTRAVTDGDQIYGVIKGTAINHGGKTNGYTVPNPQAQASVIKRALTEAAIDPRTISYVEAHGTGTALGDPIEITGLSKAFREYTQEKQFCAIGSVKSNIGHCESAAGMAALTKVLLQMKHHQLVPSLHAEKLNPRIDFQQTPFIVQQRLADWKRPELSLHGVTRPYPRRASISSFGAGGSNAHVIIEEYIPVQPLREQEASSPQRPYLIVLSARNEERLAERAQQLLAALREGQFVEEDLPDIAYTLQVGREAMDARLGLLVHSLRELEAMLVAYGEGQESFEGLYRGLARSKREAFSPFSSDEEWQEVLAKWMQQEKYEKLLEAWVNGLSLNWSSFYTGRKPRRISLPTYPFARERYWVPTIDIKAGVDFAGHAVVTDKQAPASNGSTETQPEHRQVHPVAFPSVMRSLQERLRSAVQPLNLSGAADEAYSDTCFAEVQGAVTQLLSRLLEIGVEDLDSHAEIEEYLSDPVLLAEFASRLSQEYRVDLRANFFVDYPTISNLSTYLVEKTQGGSRERTAFPAAFE
ncbi:MAG TPA: beta-ketoacyl synthase N-terminal-like domain-containing protein, partial [Ktedonobacteraceae bacterium]|nr:beta-ketoacyl synthase N-terminal-like domain-containing protein [Ktedonobacteraceae bacterium]